MNKCFVFTTALVAAVRFAAGSSVSGDRIWVDSEINGVPARLFLDTGSDRSVLTTTAAARLGLRIMPTSEMLVPEWQVGETDEVSLKVNGQQFRSSFLVLRFPRYTGGDEDGALSLHSLSNTILRIDASSTNVFFLTKLPKEARRWTRFRTSPGSGCLELGIDMPGKFLHIVRIDTGAWDGVALSPAAWRAWRTAHPSAPRTFQTSFTPSDGDCVLEEAWADEVRLGPITLRDVPITQAGPSDWRRWGTNHYATLGMAAISRLDMIVDRAACKAYLRVAQRPPTDYPHNRLGAVFVPTTEHTNKAVALVLPQSPAYEAGVRNGDILLSVGDVPATSWNSRWLRQFEAPAGTRLVLRLERDGKEITNTVVLRDLLRPKARVSGGRRGGEVTTVGAQKH